MVPDWAKQYIGKEFRDNARGPDAYDCWGLMLAVLREQYHIDAPQLSDEYIGVDDARIPDVVNAQRASGLWHEVDAPLPGDVVLMRIMGREQHVGVVVSHSEMLTIERGTLSCIERYNSLRWKGRVSGFFRFMGART